MMTSKNKSFVTKSVFLDANISTSSDFITTLYELCRKIHQTYLDKLNLVYECEYDNWSAIIEKNVDYISKKVDKFSQSDCKLMYDGYSMILEFFLVDTAISSKYKMDDTDKVGWQIFKEISEKRDYCRKMFVIKGMS